MAEFRFECEQTDLNGRALSSALANEAESNAPLTVELVFVGSEQIRKLNAQSRGVDAVTDVLSFPSLSDHKGQTIDAARYPYDTDEDGSLFLGSVVICPQRAAEQAEEYGHSLQRELYYLAVHGVCHLLGYDHMTDEDKKEMREKEEKKKKKLGVARE